MATLQCGAREISDRMGSIFEPEDMQVQNINNPEKITVSLIPKHKRKALYVVPETDPDMNMR